MWYNQMYNSVEHFWSYCGEMQQPFDPEKYICCKGYLRPLLGSRYLSRCCGSLTYNRRTHLCCNGKIRRNYLNNIYAKPRLVLRIVHTMQLCQVPCYCGVCDWGFYCDLTDKCRIRWENNQLGFTETDSFSYITITLGEEGICI